MITRVRAIATLIASGLLLAGCASTTQAGGPPISGYNVGAANVAAHDPACTSVNPSGLDTHLTAVTCKLDGHYVIINTWQTPAQVAAQLAVQRSIPGRAYYTVGTGWTASVNDHATSSVQHTIAVQIAHALGGKLAKVGP